MQGSTLSSAPDPPAGPEIEFTYTTLPAANAHLGPKTLTLTHGLVPDQDTREVEIFFPRCATNHPGEGTGVTPNWYYYWSQTSAHYGTHTFNANSVGSYTDFVDNAWRAFIGTGAHTQSQAWLGAEGIDYFAHICRHEERHRLDFSSLWGAGNGRNDTDDPDGDYLPTNNGEVTENSLGMPFHEGGYDPEEPATFADHFNYGAGWRDCEDYCMHREEAWTNGSADSVDWASDGHQWSE